MAFSTTFGAPAQTGTQQFPVNPLLQALQASQAGTLGQPSPFNLTAGTNQTGYFSPIQNEIGNTQTEAGNLYSGLANQFTSQQGQLFGDLTNQMNAGLTSSIPGIEDRLQSLGLAQSGAYPEALAQQRGQILSNSILPTMTNFDTQAFNQLNAIPQNAMNTIQGLQQGSVGRGFNLQDIANQQQFQGGLANQSADVQRLQAMLGLAPALIGQGGLPGLMGGGGAGGSAGGAGGSAGGGGGLGGLSQLFPGLGGSAGQGGMMDALLSGGYGAGGAALGQSLGLGGAGSGALAGLGGLLGGGGALGGLGAGLGGAFGGSLGAGIGGAVGDVLNPMLMNSGWMDSLATMFDGADSSMLSSLGSILGF